MAEPEVILKKNRSVIRTSVNKFINQIQELLKDEKANTADIEEALEHLNENAAELKRIDSEILTLIPEKQIDGELQGAEELREKITTWRFRASKKIKEIKQVPLDTVNTTENVKIEKVNVKLPKLQIIKFSGNIAEWLTFWSAFENAIHKNETLDPVDKFNYLRTYLAGTALKSIEGLAVTADNYKKAIDLLVERFGKKENLIDVHMNHLLNLMPLKNSNDIKRLRMLYDELQIQIRSLESLDISLSSYGNLLSPIILKLLPRDIIIEFNKENINKTYSAEDILSFLFKQLTAREKLNTFEHEAENAFPPHGRSAGNVNRKAPARNNYPAPNQPDKQNKKPSACDLLIQSKPEKEKCSFCDLSSHESNNCDFAKSLNYSDRLNLLRKKGICFRCLKIGKHIAKDCRANIFCSLCKYKHADIMCNRQPRKQENEDALVKENNDHILSNQVIYSSVYLQTLIAQIEGENSSGYIRLLIDTGSQNSYVSKYVAEKLKLRKIKGEKIKHGLFGGVEKTEEHSRYRFTLSNINRKFSCEIEALDQKKICSGVKIINDNRLIKNLRSKGIKLTDIQDNSTFCMFEENNEEIHLLLGADVAANLFTENVKYFPDVGLTAFETKLGWTIMGKRGNKCIDPENSLAVLSLSLHVSNADLAEFWRLDTIGIKFEENKTKEILEEEAEKYFLETVKRDVTGRYEVSLPWMVDRSLLANNRSIAESSLYKVEKKLINSNKKKEYDNIFQLWEAEEIIQEIIDDKSEGVHFIPHRPVIKESSETTKIRPVFNASAHVKNSPSLNDCLAKGPNLIEIIPSILNRFRKYKVGLSSDIEKAFLQIKITEKDRDFLRFLWFNKDEGKSLKIYRHCRVVFGLTSSPFLLSATLKHLLSNVPPSRKETARILDDSFYMDNSLTSLNSEPEATKFKEESIELLASGHFNLRCWRSNLPALMLEEKANKPQVTPVLGLIWDLEKDSLSCKIDGKFAADKPYTKRKILSVLQKIFDPIGFTTPITLVPKRILQETWVQKIKWDEELPEPMQKQFSNWLKSSDNLPQISIPRWLNLDNKNENLTSLHVFSDACRYAYATCVFIRKETAEGVRIQLVNARSRVAPIKKLTIPRLELLSCLMGARLAKTIMTDLHLANIKTTYWSDSTTALGWIRREQAWGTYVHNRVREIKILTKVSDWKHVPGNLNPADLPSRGCSVGELLKSRWWEGPSWLYRPEDEWPQKEEPPEEELINKERRKTILNLLDKKENSDWYYHYFSSYRKTVRMLAWIYRFVHNIKKLEKNLSSDISVDEFERAEKTLLKLIQKESFSGRTDPKIRALRPLEDDNGLLRAKTNIVQRNDEEDFRYPIILPSNHPVVRRLIFEKHVDYHHAGVSLLMSQLRENLWILKSRKAIRNVIRKCVKCKRFQTSRIEVERGIPPEDRVREAAIFEVVGVDLAGPLYLSNGSKVWIALFTCAVYRAIHLELVTALSTESFIQALRRFIARRGRPYVIYSDNGKNFIGTNRALASLDWDVISSRTAVQKIRWKFNPPSAAWWGGWWERLVRMVKEILRKVLGRASLNYEELLTILCDCEQLINSRPITYVSEDNQDPTPLTPKMFLQELPSSGVPDLDTLDTTGLNRRAKYRQRLRNDLKKRFRNEYLGQLRQQATKTERFKQLKAGDIVLLEDTNKYRINWPLAKIIKIYPGKDNIVRLAKVKTENGTLLRPVQRLFPLEISSSDTVDYPTFKNTAAKQISAVSDELSATTKTCATTSPVVTRTGRIVRPPFRFQSDR